MEKAKLAGVISWRALTLLVVSVAWCCPAKTSWAAPAESQERFLRVQEGAGGTVVALEAAIVRFVPEDGDPVGPVVDLVAAVHVADQEYYEELNRRFAQYDAVLYELVAPQGAHVPKGGGDDGGSFVTAVQRSITNLLELKFQLDQIDYTRRNFVHADMTPEQFARSMRTRGESFLQIIFRLMAHGAAQGVKKGQPASDLELLLALFDKDRALKLKRIVAHQMVDLEETAAVVDGPGGSTLVSERNKVVIRVLQQQVASGKRNLAIFYGAGHMPDLAQRLQKDLHLKPAGTQWLVAWELLGR